VIATIQYLIFVVLAILILAVEVYALVDAARRPARAFTSEGKLTKPLWLVILGVATALGVLALPTSGGRISPLGFLSIIGVVAAIVYLVDVRPRLQPYSGKGRPQRPNGW
jgi:uncharacterized membrane protein YeiB